MKTVHIRAWYLVHKWTSLVCTAFLLMLCLTGLPLIFTEEINHALAEGPALPPGPANAALLPLDRMVTAATDLYPGERPLFMSFDDDRPVVNVTTAPTADAKRDTMHITAFDRRTGKPLGLLPDNAVMAFLLQLHTDMFLGLPGALFLGFMGLLFFAAIVSGVVLYAPFMRKIDFGTIRTSRKRRVRWLDLHNMLGIVTTLWLGVVGLTGVVNTLAEPLVDHWRTTELASLIRPYSGQAPAPRAEWGSLDTAMAAALAAAPGMTPQFVAFPGVRFTSAHHYAVWLRGTTPATARIYTPALLDVRTARLSAITHMPWYMLALRLSQPLHFGDYGALPLKILWALLDIAAIVVLGSGLYLWLGKRSRPLAARVREVESGGLVAAE